MSNISTSNTADFDEQAQRVYATEHAASDDIFSLTRQLLAPGSKSPDFTVHQEQVLPLISTPRDECFGVSKDRANTVIDLLTDVKDSQLHLVGHVNPDFDCLASIIIMQQVICRLSGSATIHAHAANIESILARTPGVASKFEVLPLPSEIHQGQIVLIDAIDPHASNVRLNENIVPYLILDNHHGEMKGKYGVAFPEHVALSTAMAGILIHTSPPEHFQTKEFSIQAALAVLAIYTDSGEFMRANQYDSEALKVLLPFADRGILEEFAGNSIEQEAATLVESLRPYKAATRDVSLFAAQLPALRNRDLGGAAADLVMRNNPSLSACLLTSPEKPLEIEGISYEQTRGFLRVRAGTAHSPEILSLAGATFNGNTFGARGLEVAGGVAKRILVTQGSPRSSLGSDMIQRFLLKGVMPNLTIDEITEEVEG